MDDDDVEFEEELKPDMKLADVSRAINLSSLLLDSLPLQVFEPTEIRKKLLSEDDDLIRAQDIPERMQLATASLSHS